MEHEKFVAQHDGCDETEVVAAVPQRNIIGPRRRRIRSDRLAVGRRCWHQKAVAAMHRGFGGDGPQRMVLGIEQEVTAAGGDAAISAEAVDDEAFKHRNGARSTNRNLLMLPGRRTN